MASKGNREIITMECQVCKSRNYSTTKNRRVHPGRVEFTKYCPRCNKHTAHKQTR